MFATLEAIRYFRHERLFEPTDDLVFAAVLVAPIIFGGVLDVRRRRRARRERA